MLILIEALAAYSPVFFLEIIFKVSLLVTDFSPTFSILQCYSQNVTILKEYVKHIMSVLKVVTWLIYFSAL